MITSRQRAYLRGLANGVKSLYQIGKEGISDNVIRQLDDALEARELIKITILADMDTHTVCGELAQRLNAEPVQAIGSKAVIYRMAGKPQNRKIKLPKGNNL